MIFTKRHTTTILATAMLFFASALFAQDSVVINIDSLAQVRAPRIEIGEIAEIAGADEGLVEKIKAIELGRAPWPGYARAISVLDIKKALSEHSVDLADVVFEGTDAVKVETRCVTVAGEKMVSLVQDYIMENMPWDPDDVILEFTRFPRSMQVPEGRTMDFTVTCRTSARDFRKNVQFTVGIKVDSKVYKSVPVTVKIRVFQDVLVTTSRLRRHTRCDSESVSLERREVTYIDGSAVSDPDYAAKYRTRMAVGRNKVLRENMIEQIPAVLKNAEVTVLYNNNGLSITSKGTARENGYIGDVIRVRNETSGKVFRARIQDDYTVVVG